VSASQPERGRRPSSRALFQQTAAYTVMFLVALAGTVGLLWRAGDIWAATHGHGTPGTWTATYKDTGGNFIQWYGDFAPQSGGPIKPHVPMEGFVDGKEPVRAVYRSGTAYKVPGTGQWLALTLIATLPLIMAAFMAWCAIEPWRPRRRRLPLRPFPATLAADERSDE
jgi:hypothetical protein